MKLFNIENSLRVETEQAVIDFYKNKMHFIDKSVAILTCIGVDSQVHSMYTMGLLKALKPKKNTVLYKIGHFIDHNRNELAREAIEGGYDYLIFVDSDIALNPYTIARMLVRAEEYNIPVQSGIYMQKRPFYKFQAYKNMSGELEGIILSIDELQQYLGKTTLIDAAGAGCLFIDCNIFKELPTPWFRTTIDANNVITGEDFYFFDKLADQGIKTVLDGEVVRHCEGQHIFPDDLMNGWIDYGWRTKEYVNRQKFLRNQRLQLLKGF